MLPLLIYEVKVAVAIILFYLFWRLLLQKETFHRLNRAVLVGTVIFSFILPFLIITVKKSVEAIPATVPDDTATIFSPDGELAVSAAAVTPWWQIALVAAFCAGVIFVLARIVISLLSIRKVLRGSTIVKREDGYILHVTEKDIDPFSWMNNIVISRKDYEKNSPYIIAHEKAHIALRHSAELLTVDILSCMQWFNPVIWTLRSDLKEIHEYEADDAVLRQGADIKEYQYLLIRKAVSKSGYSVANSFNHSILKNRITMMSKSKSPLRKGLRVLYIVPLVCLGLALQARTIYVPIDKDSEIISSQDGKKGILPEVSVVRYGDNIDPSMIIKVEDQFTATALSVDPIWSQLDSDPVCSENFSFWLTTRIHYPKDCFYEGTMFVSFNIGKNGKVKNVEIIKGVCDELDSQVVSLIENSPSWTPAKKGGKVVEVKYIQPIIFKINIAAKKATPTAAVATTPRSMELEVGSNNGTPVIKCGGTTIALDKLGEFLKSNGMTDASSVINIKSESSLTMKTLDAVKDEIRKAGATKVNYTIPKDEAPKSVGQGSPQIKSSTSPQVLATWENGKSNCLIKINSEGTYFIKDKVIKSEDVLKMAKDFLVDNGRETTFAILYDKETNYSAFHSLQSTIHRAYTEVRNEQAVKDFGKSFDELSDSQKEDIQKKYPIKVAQLY